MKLYTVFLNSVNYNDEAEFHRYNKLVILAKVIRSLAYKKYVECSHKPEILKAIRYVFCSSVRGFVIGHVPSTSLTLRNP